VGSKQTDGADNPATASQRRVNGSRVPPPSTLLVAAAVARVRVRTLVIIVRVRVRVRMLMIVTRNGLSAEGVYGQIRRTHLK
jgi:hypothetical protein